MGFNILRCQRSLTPSMTSLQGVAVMSLIVSVVATSLADKPLYREDVDGSALCPVEHYWDMSAEQCRPCSRCAGFNWPIIPCSSVNDRVCAKVPFHFPNSSHFMEDKWKPVLQINVISPTTVPTVTMGTASLNEGFQNVAVTSWGLVGVALVVLVFILSIKIVKKHRVKQDFSSLEFPLTRMPDDDTPRYMPDPTSQTMSSREMLKSHGHGNYQSTSGHLRHDPLSTSVAAGPVLWFPTRDLDLYEEESDLDSSGTAHTDSGSGEYVYIKKVYPSQMSQQSLEPV